MHHKDNSSLPTALSEAACRVWLTSGQLEENGYSAAPSPQMVQTQICVVCWGGNRGG